MCVCWMGTFSQKFFYYFRKDKSQMEAIDVYKILRDRSILGLKVSLMTATLVLLRQHIETADAETIARTKIQLIGMIDNALEATDDELMEVSKG